MKQYFWRQNGVMKIGILGTGTVGETIASALAGKGHHVFMGSRTTGNEKAKTWVKKAGKNAAQGNFEDAALYGDIVFLCLNGEYTLETVKNMNVATLSGKIVVDVTNPLDFTQGVPPRILEDFRTVSLGERIQEAVPNAYVIKALNTMNANLMVDARKVANGNHNLFLCGNDVNAKNQLKHFLVDNFYWKPDSFIDLGDIKAARYTEAMVPFWVLLWQSLGTPLFNFKIMQ